MKITERIRRRFRNVSHFLGNVIGYVLYFSLLGILRIFAHRGYFRKQHMGRGKAFI